MTRPVFFLVTGSVAMFFPTGVQAQPSGGGSQPAGAWRVGTPIATYWAGPGYGGQPLVEAEARQVAEAGFNLAWATEKELDVAHKHKLRALLNDALIAPATLDDAGQRGKLDALIDRVKVHPAMYAYFITDEPAAGAFPALGKLVAYLRERDPAHMAYINLFPTYATNEQLGTQGDVVTAYREHLRQYIEVVKPALISWDHYQFAIEGRDNDQYFLNLALIRKASMDAGLPYLNIVQACTWAPEAMRSPGPDELRYLVYTTLAYGAQGISYFVYSYPPMYKPGTGQLVTPEGKTTDLYDAVKKLNPEFVAIASELQKLTSLAIYHAGMVPRGGEALPADCAFRFEPALPRAEHKPPAPIQGLMIGLFGASAGKPTHAVVVNLSYKEPATTKLVASGAMSLFDASAGKWGREAKDGLELRLVRGGGALVRLVQPR